MSEDDLTVHILRELREEIRATNQRVDSLDQRFDRLDQRVDRLDQRFDRLDQGLRAELATTRDHLGQRILETELRISTRITEQTAATRDLYDLLHANLALRDRVERCEHDVAEIKTRLD